MKIGSRQLALLALVIASVFMRLGFWQLGRLNERRTLNAELASRAVAPTVPISRSPTDTANARYRRVSFDGAYDYGNEIVLTLRSSDGSPGVNIVTPVRVPGSDTALLVVRGWVYSADGMTVDLNRWRETAQAQGDGFVETFPPARTGRNSSPSHSNAYRWLDRAELEKRFRYPLAPFYVVLTSPPADSRKTVPPRRSRPALILQV